MRSYRELAAILAGLWLAACGAPHQASSSEEVIPEIGPRAFAALRCPGVESGSACLLVRAGGKTLVFGAPEGAMSALEAIGEPVPDGVFIATLTPPTLEGVARLRNRSWALGRTVPLSLIGPAGIEVFASSIDEAYARSDAVVYLKARPTGNFDAALLAPTAVPPSGQVRVFDSGDLTVDAMAAVSGELTFLVRYDGRALQVAPCDGAVTPLPGVPLDSELGCDALSNPAEWPHTAQILFILH